MKPNAGMKAGQLQFYVPSEMQANPPKPTGKRL